MAIEVAPDYGGEITPGLIVAASDGLKAMRRLGQIIVSTAYPSNLPIGSGNEWSSRNTSHFYPSQEAEILSETTGAIGLESNTVGV